MELGRERNGFLKGMLTLMEITILRGIIEVRCMAIM